MKRVVDSPIAISRKPSDIAKLAAEIVEKLDALKPDEAAKVLRVVAELRAQSAAVVPDFTPPRVAPPSRREIEQLLRSRPAPSLQTYH